MKPSLMAAAALAGLAFAGVAHAQNTSGPQWYVRGNAGATYQDKINSTPQVKGESGWTIDGAVGRQVDSNFRVEGQIIYSEDNAKVGDADLKMAAGLANGYYDFDTGTKFRPYVGAGVGIGQVKVDGGSAQDDDTGFAYQLMTGVAYPINDRLTAQVGYRYLGVNDVKMASDGQSIRGDYRNQAATFGLIYKFGR